MWGFSLKRLGNLEVVLKDKNETLTICFGKASDSRTQSLWKDGIKKKDRSIYIYKNIYYITFSVSNFGFCKVHFYSCYIMWKKLTLIYLKRKKSVNSLLFESVFIFLVFILTFDRTIAIRGPFGNGLVYKRKSISSSILFSPLPSPGT